ncbi:MAG: hypothetical protein WA125_17505 [Desulfosporosinus sp.]
MKRFKNGVFPNKFRFWTKAAWVAHIDALAADADRWWWVDHHNLD